MAKRAPQVPGAAPADTSTDTTGEAPEAAPVEEGKAPKGKGELTRDDYAKMRAKDVDAKTLKSSVLTLDGWVVPDLPPQAPVRA